MSVSRARSIDANYKRNEDDVRITGDLSHRESALDFDVFLTKTPKLMLSQISHPPR